MSHCHLLCVYPQLIWFTFQTALLLQYPSTVSSGSINAFTVLLVVSNIIMIVTPFIACAVLLLKWLPDGLHQRIMEYLNKEYKELAPPAPVATPPGLIKTTASAVDGNGDDGASSRAVHEAAVDDGDISRANRHVANSSQLLAPGDSSVGDHEAIELAQFESLHVVVPTGVVSTAASPPARVTAAAATAATQTKPSSLADAPPVSVDSSLPWPLLPALWIEYETENGEPYFFNPLTQESTWIKPPV